MPVMYVGDEKERSLCIPDTILTDHERRSIPGNRQPGIKLIFAQLHSVHDGKVQRITWRTFVDVP